MSDVGDVRGLHGGGARRREPERRLRLPPAGGAGDALDAARSRARRRSPRRRAASPVGWTRALASCEDANARGVNVPPLDCSTDPDGDIARAKAKSASRVASCDSFAGHRGLRDQRHGGRRPTACFESAIGPQSCRATRGCPTHDHASRNAGGWVARCWRCCSASRPVARGERAPTYFEVFTDRYGITPGDRTVRVRQLPPQMDRHRRAQSVRQRRRAAALRRQVDHAGAHRHRADGHRRRRLLQPRRDRHLRDARRATRATTSSSPRARRSATTPSSRRWCRRVSSRSTSGSSRRR